MLKNNITDFDTLNKGMTLAIQKCASIGFTLEFTFANTTKQFSSIPMTSDVVSNGYEVNPTEIFQEAKRLGYIPALDSICMLVYNWRNINPQPTNPVDNGQVVQLPENWYQNFPAVFCEYALHEILHYLFSATNQLDTTHAYPPAFSQKTRTDYYLYLIMLLEPYFNALQSSTSPVIDFKPDVVIIRRWDDGTQFLGELTTNEFSAKTMELSWKLNLKNISCIPRGLYTCRWTWSWKFMRYTYEVLNVPNRSGIRIHAGNFWFTLQGCIALGNKYGDLNQDKWADLINSRATISAFEKLFNKRNFILKIK